MVGAEKARPNTRNSFRNELGQHFFFFFFFLFFFDSGMFDRFSATRWSRVRSM